MSPATTTNNKKAILKIVGDPKPGEALRAVILGDLNKSNPLRSNAEEDDAKNKSLERFVDIKVEYKWVKRPITIKKSKIDDDRDRDDRPSVFVEIVGANAPIYFVQKEDCGYSISARAVILRVNKKTSTKKEAFLRGILHS